MYLPDNILHSGQTTLLHSLCLLSDVPCAMSYMLYNHYKEGSVNISLGIRLPLIVSARVIFPIKDSLLVSDLQLYFTKDIHGILWMVFMH